MGVFMNKYTIMDKKPASDWEESFPVGNGRMGASLMCGVGQESIYLNEETLWASNDKAGNPNPDMSEKLHAIRQLFLDGKPAEGDKLAKETFVDCFSRIRSYETAGCLNVCIHRNDKCKGYRKELNLMEGIARVSYFKDGQNICRECYASYPDDVIVYSVKSDFPLEEVCISYERELVTSRECNGSIMHITGKTMFGNHGFGVTVKAETDGDITTRYGDMYITGATKIVFYINVITEFKAGDAYKAIAPLPSITEEEIRIKHVADFSAIMNKADIILDCLDGVDDVSMEERLLAHRHCGGEDNAIIILLWQFGRYILASSSRTGCLPANLQGLWADKLNNKWTCDYHTNINLQSNYWCAEVANLSDCHKALINYMNNYLLESGKKTAKEGYKTRGCVVHHVSDIYGFTTPADGLWGIWPHGASWLSYHVWEHYLYTGDKEFLKNEGYEFIRQAAIFFLENLVEDQNGYLVYGPSTSPENRYWVDDENGNKYACYLTLSSTMDVGIIDGLFRNYIDASQVLGIDDDDVQGVKAALIKMPPFKVSKTGRIQEWAEDYEETAAGHFHLSHTFPLFPGRSVNRSMPHLMEAISKTVDSRIEGGIDVYGHGATNIGWSLGWMMCLLARLRRGNSAYDMIMNFINLCVNTTLHDISAHCWQIDGNMGFVAGVCEMLIQSHEGVVALVPSLPVAWQNGSFRGLKARGGYELEAAWSDYSVEEFTVKSSYNKKITVELPEGQKSYIFKGSDGKIYTAEKGILELEVSGAINLKICSLKNI